jgi:hypothetical protein
MGFIVFIILLSVASFVVPNISNSVYSDVIQFFNANVAIFFILFFIGMINEIFWSFYFPFNIIAPITSSVLSIFVISFFYKVWLFIDGYVHTNAYIPITMIYPIVIILTFIIGYVIIFTRGARRFGEKIEVVSKRKERRTKRTEWEDVGEEFRQAFYNLGRAINDSFEKKEKEIRKRRSRRRGR